MMFANCRLHCLHLSACKLGLIANHWKTKIFLMQTDADGTDSNLQTSIFAVCRAVCRTSSAGES
jgi:hypothetical protein